MMPPAPGDRRATRARDYVRRTRSLFLGASTIVALCLACGPHDALVGAQNPKDENGQPGAGTGGSPGFNSAGTTTAGTATAGGSTTGQAGGMPIGGAKGGTGGSGVAAGCERCSELPHVRPDAIVDCLDGECVFVQDACEDGFAHCLGDFSEVGCESSLSDSAHCGECHLACPEPLFCQASSGYICGCEYPAQECNGDCVDLQTNRARCGACDNACEETERCSEGACDVCPAYRANCRGQNSCGDWLRSADNCGSCGRACSTVSMSGACTAQGECQPVACTAGRADCDAQPEDCESALNQAESCGPEYVGTVALAQDYTWWALGPDGSWLATRAGTLHKFSAAGELVWSYSPPRGAIWKVALDAGGVVFVIGDWSFNFHDDTADTGTFIAKLNAHGEPVWERELEPIANAGKAFPGPIAVDGSGTVLSAVWLQGQVDVDPTSGVDVQRFDSEWWLLEFDANGALSGAREFAATGEGVVCHVTIDALARSPGRTLVAGDTVSDCELAGKVAPPGPHNSGNIAFIASMSSSGSADAVRWLIGANTRGGSTDNDGSSLVAYPDGSAALVASIETIGTFEPVLYFEDSSQLLVAAEHNQRFVARFSAELELQWLKVGSWISSPAAAPRGGLLTMFRPELTFALLPPPVPTLWRADGSSAWTMPGCCYVPNAVGASGEIFAVRRTGVLVAGACDPDLDPGPDTVTVAETAMVTTYRF